MGRAGQAPGLSFRLHAERNRKAQVVDFSLLTVPLAAIPDDPSKGGTPGHISVAPVDQNGDVDNNLLIEWAESRGTGKTHALTQILLDSIVGEVRK